ncbi:MULTISPECIES: hypothetical protein [Providencia]|uniref:hypothetical protein n=1 Tax=Providencia TaxID=586 RepID=UPI00197F4D3B|nr:MULTISPECIES: hypothetical protein [Providencia]MBN4865353.1 hypothetical protein [Providencia stuartii]MBN4874422.1 hypothetical protein [Providencia stuartii]MBN4879366.1 hypothetical protein [Providencia stuartii]MBN4883623.1 hypothetical protein [Providencia stuartii]
MIKGILITFFVLVLAGCSTNKLDAPYGFKWGQTPADVKRLNLVGLQCTEFQENGALCSTPNTPTVKGRMFLLMFSREENTLMLISAQGKDSRDQGVILAEYDEINQKMYEKYGIPKKTIERYKRDSFFLDKISDDETTPFKRVYEQNGMQIMVGIVSNSHFKKIHNKKDIIYSVMTIYNLILDKPQEMTTKNESE